MSAPASRGSEGDRWERTMKEFAVKVRPPRRPEHQRYAGTAGQYAVIAAIVLPIAFAAVRLH
jgi:hypothetical protein